MIIRMRMLAVMIGVLGFVENPDSSSTHDQLWRHRNLGKAYYENPMTQMQAVDEFKQALALAPDSARDRVNYGLALLRGGNSKEAVAELMKAQRQDPSIPQTWFNLGIAYKRNFDSGLAAEQFEGMLKLVPDEPVTHYNLGISYKLIGKPDLARTHFMLAARFDPNFAAPHFQLYNAYRETGRSADAARELEEFNEIKKRKAGSAVPEDPEWSYYSEVYDPLEVDGPMDHEISTPVFRFQARQVASGIKASSVGLAVLDFDGDGRPDLIVWSENGVQLLKNGITPVADPVLTSLRGVISIAPGDFNNDGLPDLAVITRAGPALYVNRGGRFELYPIKMPEGSFSKAVWIDYDHDYDLDLVLLGEKSVLLRNEGTAGFHDETARFPFVAGRAVDGTVIDMVPDSVARDLAVLYSDGSTVVYRDQLLGHYQAQRSMSGGAPGVSIQAFDINNDGWTDLILTTGSGARFLINDHGTLKETISPLAQNGPLAISDFANRSLADVIVGGSFYRNNGSARFERVPADVLPACVAIVQADFDGDGLPDLVAVTEKGSVVFFKNVTKTTNRFLEVRLEGVKNLKQANGAVVEVKAGAWYQKKMYRGVPLLFGLRDYDGVDTVRITWPNGLVQNETKQPVGQVAAFKEKSRLSGSCPMIFAWNGQAFEFVTDVLGVAPLGASSGDGRYFPVNHQERVSIPSSALQPRDGHFEIRITEELREISYLDQVSLLAVDHKPDEQIFTSDKFKAPPFPSFRLYGVRHKTYPITATDLSGRSLLGSLVGDHSQHGNTFSCGPGGTSDLHGLTLDFGQAARNNQAILVLKGWVDWPDGSTFAARAQEPGSALVFPYLQVEDAKGQWRTVIPDMGMPSGKAKTIVVDLTGKFLSASRKVRVVTNLCIYWEEIFLSEETQTPVTALKTLAPASAELRYRGFSRTKAAVSGQPEQFDYAHWSPQSMWNPTPGLYTRYGDVRDLLARIDDRMVIMGSGDELRLTFDLRQLPRLLPGRTRDYLLLVDGWAKDADANTAYGNTVLPLPFHAMSRYPYPPSEHYPGDRAHRLYLRKYNTRSPVRNLSPLRRADNKPIHRRAG